MNQGRSPKRLNVQLLKGHHKKLREEKRGSKVVNGIILQAGHLKWKKAPQKQQVYTEVLKLNKHSEISSRHTWAYTNTCIQKHNMIFLFKYSSILQELLKGKSGEKRSRGVNSAEPLATQKDNMMEATLLMAEIIKGHSTGSINPTERLLLQRSSASTIENNGMLKRQVSQKACWPEGEAGVDVRIIKCTCCFGLQLNSYFY